MSGHPVIVFENLGLTWYPFWHYALVYGYDLKEAELIMHSGPDEGRRIDPGRLALEWDQLRHWSASIM